MPKRWWPFTKERPLSALTFVCLSIFGLCVCLPFGVYVCLFGLAASQELQCAVCASRPSATLEQAPSEND